MSHPLVVNLKVAPYDVYIGRKSTGMHYGNPFSHLNYGLASVRVSTREESVQAYDDWLNGDPKWAHVDPQRREWILNHITELKGKILGCYCAPQSCHGDVLARRANS